MQKEWKDEDRKKMAIVAMIVLGMLAVVWFSVRSGGDEKRGISNENTVAATIFPIYDIVRNVAGDELEVVLILPPGASPHTYEPSPSTLLALQRAEIAYAIGYGLDDWVDGLLQNAETEKLVVDKGMTLRMWGEGGSEEADHGQGDEDDGVDPHYWLDILNGMAIARTVAADLSARFPDSARVFDRNLDVYLTRLRETHTSLLEILEPVQDKGLVTIHDAWGYFADEYGLRIVGAFEPSPGRVPTPKYLAALTEAMKEAGTRTLFTEPQVSTASLKAFLEDNDLEIAILDPLGGESGRASYIELMIYNAKMVLRAR